MIRRRVVAITGATGFLGAHVVAALAREGASLRILARRDPVHDLWRGLTFDIERGSLEDLQALERLTDGADAVVHIAGLIKARDRTEFFRVNRDGTRAMAKATRRHAPAARFIAVSSLTAREPQLSDYAASKHAGELEARDVYSDAENQLVIVRPPAIYGPWDRETLALFKGTSRKIAPVFGTGRIAIVHVADATAAIAQLAMGLGEAGLYALADPNPGGYTMIEMLSEAARATGSHPRLLHIPDTALIAAGKLSALWGRLRGIAPIFTAGKAREMLHADWSVAPDEMLPPTVYRSKRAMAEGFRETVAWYKAAGWLA